MGNSYETNNAATATERMTLKVKFDVLLNTASPLIRNTKSGSTRKFGSFK